ncbi:MAG TPA: hypothetical protein VIB39_13065 [Candidatus Angelobacter sp.]|jgi:hypothetical protein
MDTAISIETESPLRILGENLTMKNMLVKLLILGGLFLTATAALPIENQRFEGPNPYPCGLPGLPACPNGN